MKYATATYVGKMRSNSYRLPGEANIGMRTFRRDEPQDVESLQAAEHLAEKEVFEVDWTIRGRAAQSLTSEYDEPEEMLNAWGYRALQRLAKAMGVKANQSEEELEEELQEEVRELQRDMESRR